MTTCKHCGRTIVRGNEGEYEWVDPEAPLDTDDVIWRETCDRHDTFMAEHEPAPHADLLALAEVARTHDTLAQQLGLHPFKDVLHLDEEAFREFAVLRIPITDTVSDMARESMIKMFTDAFALGQAYAQRGE